MTAFKHILLLVIPIFLQISVHSEVDTSFETLQSKLFELYQSAGDATVLIVGRKDKQVYSGSGAIISANGTIATAAHVVPEQLEELTVYLNDGRSLKAVLLERDRSLDLAIIQAQTALDLPKFLPGDVTPSDRFSPVVLLGYPGGAVKGRPLPMRLGHILDVTERGQLIHTRSSIMAGDSGGPVVNISGELIGITTAIGTSFTDNKHASIYALKNMLQRVLARKQNEKLDYKAHLPPHFDLLQFYKDYSYTVLKVKNKEPLLRELLKGHGFESSFIDSLSSRQLAIFTGYLFKPLTNPKEVISKQAEGSEYSVEQLVQQMERSGTDVSGLAATLFNDLLDTGKYYDYNRTSLQALLMAYDAPASWVEVSVDELGNFFKKLILDHINKELEQEAPFSIFRLKLVMLKASLVAGRTIKIDEAMVQQFLHSAGMTASQLEELSIEDKMSLIEQADRIKPASHRVNKLAELSEQINREQQVRLKSVGTRFARTQVEVYSGTTLQRLGYALAVGAHDLMMKSSMIVDDFCLVKLYDGRLITAYVEARDTHSDLALFSIGEPLVHFLQSDLFFKPVPGSLVFSNTLDSGADWGVISTAEWTMRPGTLGIHLKRVEERWVIDSVEKGTAADLQGLLPNDELIAINAIKINSTAQLQKALALFPAGRTHTVTVKRDEEELSLNITPEFTREIAVGGGLTTGLGVELSEKRSGFPCIFQHDCKINAPQCGSLLLTFEGQPVGMNIARSSRAEVLAVSGQELFYVYNALKAKKDKSDEW